MSLFDLRRSPVERRLNKHPSTVIFGGLFFTVGCLVFLTFCNTPCEDPTYGLDHELLKRSRAKAFWENSILAPKRDLKSKLVVIVLTAPQNYPQRAAIRETYLNSLQEHEVLSRFVIGTYGLTSEAEGKLERENLVHKDLLLLDKVHDSYEDLTFKVLQTFVWLDHHVDFQYVLKIDDDSYVRVSKILAELQHKPTDKLYWGFFDGRANVKTSGKWKERKWNLCDKYLPYARGGGYVLSSDLVHYISSNSQLFQLYLSEDVSVGAWLAPLNINRHHDQNFDTEYVSRGCLNSYLVTHKQPVLKIRELHSNLVKLGRLCKTEETLRGSYEYDWSFPPSKCCIRPEAPSKKNALNRPVAHLNNEI